MRKSTRRKKDDTPEWLKSTHQALVNGTTDSEKRQARISPEKTEDELLAEALVLLEIKAEDLEYSPKIEHLFKGIGGKDKVFEYLSGSEEPDAKKLLELRKRLTRAQHRAVPFEAYCIAAVIPVKKVFGLIASEAMDQEEKAKQLLFRVKHSEVVQATIESALDLEFGAADRRMLHQAAGFVPIPKNSITHIHGNQTVDNRLQTATVTVLPPVEDTVRRLSDRFNDRVIDVPLLAAPADEEGESSEGDEDE